MEDQKDQKRRTRRKKLVRVGSNLGQGNFGSFHYATCQRFYSRRWRSTVLIKFRGKRL